MLYCSLLALLIGNLSALCSGRTSLDVGTYWRKDSKAAISAPTLFVIRLYLIVVLLFVNKHPHTTFVILAAESVYLLFLVFSRPHQLAFDLLRAIAIEISILFMLSSRFAMQHMFPSLISGDSSAYKIMSIV